MWWRWSPPQVQVFLVARQQCGGTIDSCEPVFWLLICWLLRQKGGLGCQNWLFYICINAGTLYPVHHFLLLRCFLATCRSSWWVGHLFFAILQFLSPRVILQFIYTWYDAHLCALVTFVELCVVFSSWCLVSLPATAGTDVKWCSGSISLSCYITPQIALTWGVEHQTRFNYLPAQPQTLRSPHPPDNFCQILLARQEALDGEGQWSREGWMEKKQEFRHYLHLVFLRTRQIFSLGFPIFLNLFNCQNKHKENIRKRQWEFITLTLRWFWSDHHYFPFYCILYFSLSFGKHLNAFFLPVFLYQWLQFT